MASSLGGWDGADWRAASATGECGGSFHALKGGPAWGCAWHRDRGPRACSNDRQIAGSELERMVLAAVQGAIDEEVAEHALRVALAELRQRIETSEPKALEEELVAIDRKIETALDLAYSTSATSGRSRTGCARCGWIASGCPASWRGRGPRCRPSRT